MSDIFVKNWSEFQHFKDRTPPWIKLHRDILYQRDINMISDRSFRVLVNLWLVASEDKGMEGRLPSIEDLSWRLRMSEADLAECLQELNPWIVCDDINMISGCNRDAIPEERRDRGETEAEDIKKINKKRASRIPETWTPNHSNISHAHERGYTDEQINDLAQSFFDHWTAATGKGSTALDWDAKWRTWVRNDVKWNGEPNTRHANGRSQSPAKGNGQAGPSIASAINKFVNS